MWRRRCDSPTAMCKPQIYHSSSPSTMVVRRPLRRLQSVPQRSPAAATAAIPAPCPPQAAGQMAVRWRQCRMRLNHDVVLSRNPKRVGLTITICSVFQGMRASTAPPLKPMTCLVLAGAGPAQGNGGADSTSVPYRQVRVRPFLLQRH